MSKKSSRRRSNKKSSRRRSSKKTSRKSRGRRRSSGKKSLCRQRLSKKIAKNMREYKKGRYQFPQQAIAVSYSQVKKKYPHCSRSLSRK